MHHARFGQFAGAANRVTLHQNIHGAAARAANCQTQGCHACGHFAHIELNAPTVHVYCLSRQKPLAVNVPDLLIEDEFTKVAKARAAAVARFQKQNDDRAKAEAAAATDPKEKEKILAAAHKYNPSDDPDLKPIETVFASFQSILAGTNAPSIIQGAVLTASLTKPYDILTVTTAAAGGGDRANTYFLVNLLFPPLHHSYNGGAVVAFTIRHSDGSYGTGGTIRQVYGYEKWHQPKLHGGPSRLTP